MSSGCVDEKHGWMNGMVWVDERHGWWGLVMRGLLDERGGGQEVWVVEMCEFYLLSQWFFNLLPIFPNCIISIIYILVNII